MPAKPIKQLYLKPQYLNQLQAILQQFVPNNSVLAYGSRVNNDCHDGSDLDLVIQGDCDFEQFANLKEALQESNLPMLVDLHLWQHIPTSFHENILANFVKIQ